MDSLKKLLDDLKKLEFKSIKKVDGGDYRIDFDDKLSIWVRVGQNGSIEGIDGSVPKNLKTKYNSIIKNNNVDSGVVFR